MLIAFSFMPGGNYMFFIKIQLYCKKKNKHIVLNTSLINDFIYSFILNIVSKVRKNKFTLII